MLDPPTTTPLWHAKPRARGILAKSVLRRLSKLEYTLTLKELFMLAEPPTVEAIPEDNDREGFRTLSALHTLSAQQLSAYLELAAQLADELVQEAARRHKVLGYAPSAADCLRAFTARFRSLPTDDGSTRSRSTDWSQARVGQRSTRMISTAS